jgi:aspartate aminotransferase-like enzyme
MHKKLFIPGPTEVAPEVLQKLATPMIGHRSKDASKLQKDISDKIRQVFYTQNPILLSTSSGSGLMEGSIRSLTAKRAIVFSVGAFGNRWFKMAEVNNVPADKHETELGKATTPEVVDKYLSTGKYDVFTITHNETSTGIMNPVEEIAEVRKKYPDVLWIVDTVSSMGGAKVEVDRLGIDVCITSTQKALALPPGMAICSVSPRALEHGKQVKYRGWYLDLLEIYKYIETKDHQYHATPSLPHMFALNYQLDRILAEGLEKRFARHREMAGYTRAWAKLPRREERIRHAHGDYQHQEHSGCDLEFRTREARDADFQRLWRSERKDLPDCAYGRAHARRCQGSYSRDRRDFTDVEIAVAFRWYKPGRGHGF